MKLKTKVLLATMATSVALTSTTAAAVCLSHNSAFAEEIATDLIETVEATETVEEAVEIEEITKATEEIEEISEVSEFTAFSENISLSSVGTSSDINATIAEYLKGKIAEVAKNGGSSTFTIPLEKLGLKSSYKNKDLGIQSIYTSPSIHSTDEQELKQNVKTAAENLFNNAVKNVDTTQIMNILKSDSSLASWVDTTKTATTSQTGDIRTGILDEPDNHTGCEATIEKSFQITFYVKPSYQDSNNTTVKNLNDLFIHVGTSNNININEQIATYLKEQIAEVAKNGGSSTFTIPLEKLGLQSRYENSQLGIDSISAFENKNDFEQRVQSAAESRFNDAVNSVDTAEIMSILTKDSSLASWVDKTKTPTKTANNNVFVMSMKDDEGKYGCDAMVNSTLKITFYVKPSYQDGNETTIRSQGTSLLILSAEAKEKAQAIVAKYSGKSDSEKLKGYKNEICALANFNSTKTNEQDEADVVDALNKLFTSISPQAASSKTIAEAFRYLCNLTTWKADVICYTASGNVSGDINRERFGAQDSFWNLVNIGGSSYLADIAHIDSFGENYSNILFMMPHSGFSLNKGFIHISSHYESLSSHYESPISVISLTANLRYICSTATRNELPDKAFNMADKFFSIGTVQGSLNPGQGGGGTGIGSSDYTQLSFSVKDDTLIISGTGIIPDISAQFHDLDINSIKKVEIDTGINGIGDNAFYNFTNLESINLHAKLKTIGNSAFENCINLKSEIDFGRLVTSVGKNAFKNCNSLTKVKVYGDNTNFDKTAFSGVGSASSNNNPILILPDNFNGDKVSSDGSWNGGYFLTKTISFVESDKDSYKITARTVSGVDENLKTAVINTTKNYIADDDVMSFDKDSSSYTLTVDKNDILDGDYEVIVYKDGFVNLGSLINTDKYQSDYFVMISSFDKNTVNYAVFDSNGKFIEFEKDYNDYNINFVKGAVYKAKKISENIVITTEKCDNITFLKDENLDKNQNVVATTSFNKTTNVVTTPQENAGPSSLGTTSGDLTEILKNAGVKSDKINDKGVLSQNISATNKDTAKLLQELATEQNQTVEQTRSKLTSIFGEKFLDGSLNFIKIMMLKFYFVMS